jgi:hypothetical protein
MTAPHEAPPYDVGRPLMGRRAAPPYRRRIAPPDAFTTGTLIVS